MHNLTKVRNSKRVHVRSLCNLKSQSKTKASDILIDNVIVSLHCYKGFYVNSGFKMLVCCDTCPGKQNNTDSLPVDQRGEQMLVKLPWSTPLTEQLNPMFSGRFESTDRDVHLIT